MRTHMIKTSRKKAGELRDERSAARTEVSNDTEPVWWKEAVFYQIYPRSFQDSDRDGVGDLRGIVSRLDYVRDLGVDAIWLNPVFASPNADNGYDISDYRAILPEFGTMEDFDRLVREAHARSLRVVLDLVVNHTSDEHPWFLSARSSRLSPCYDFYLWWASERGTPPLRRSHFDPAGTAWRYNPSTDSYYLHYFSARQPDLNWNNPRVRSEIYDMMRFWLDKGIDGFRMDSISYIAKDPSFPEIDRAACPDLFSCYARGPRLHEYLHEMNREVLAPYRCFSVGEGSAVTSGEVARFVEPGRQELDMLYHFGAAEVRNGTTPDGEGTDIPYSLIALKRMFTRWDAAVGEGWPAIYLGNHDQPRMVSRFGSDEPGLRELSAKMLATFLLTMRGTPFWYMGDELGMANIRFRRIDDYDDIDTRNGYIRLQHEGGDTELFLREQAEVGRDNARTPFQWNPTTYAGFSKVRPWLRVNPDYLRVNAAAQEHDAHSVLAYFRTAITFRRQHRNLIYGSYRLLDADNKRVYAYLREGGGERYLVALNFSRRNALTLPGPELGGARIALHNYPDVAAPAGRVVELRPFEAVVFEL